MLFELYMKDVETINVVDVYKDTITFDSKQYINACHKDHRNQVCKENLFSDA
jgi:hypothetical protein